MYSLCLKPCTNYTLNHTLRRFKPYTASVQNPTQRAFKTLHSERSQNYTRGGTQTIHFVFELESREWNFEREWSGWCKWSEWSKWRESYVTFVTNVTKVTNVTNVTNVKQEMAIGGDATRHSLRLFLSLSLPLSFPPFRHSFPPPKKSNNFERIFSDSTLTFLTFENTFRLPILPIRHIILLCLPLI